jgi:hypothetical protein
MCVPFKINARFQFSVISILSAKPFLQSHQFAAEAAPKHPTPIAITVLLNSRGLDFRRDPVRQSEKLASAIVTSPDTAANNPSSKAYQADEKRVANTRESQRAEQQSLCLRVASGRFLLQEFFSQIKELQV